MAISTITSAGIATDTLTAADIAADAVGSSEIGPDIALTGGSVTIPSVTTANLPGTAGGTNASQTATNGMIVYNSTLGMLQQRAEGVWKGIASSPTITSFQYSDGAAATAEKTVIVSLSCGTTNTSTTVTAASTTGIIVGQVVSGVGVPLGATVVSFIANTSFVLSSAATATATVTLTFGGVVTITGTNFDSILAGGSANIGVTFDGTSATTISVNAAKTIITCTPPAHAAGTITLLVTNASGLTASTDFVYDIEPVFTTAAGSLGSFVDGVFTANADAPRIQGTENSVALTTGFQRVTSATDDTVITTTIQGLTVLTSGYLTGTLSATEGTTYPFYATAMDNENQRTAPRLFNIISRHAYPTGGAITTYDGFKVHTFLLAGNGSSTNIFTPAQTEIVDILIIGGGACGGLQAGGGGGAGGFVYYSQKSLTAAAYTIAIGAGSVHHDNDGYSQANGTLTSFTSLTSAVGGGGGGHYNSSSGGSSHVGNNGGSGGGGATGYSRSNAAGGTGTAGPPRQGYDGGGSNPAGSITSSNRAGGGGGGSSEVGEQGADSGSGDGGDGFTEGATVPNFTLGGSNTVTFPALFKVGTGSNLSYAGGGGGGGQSDTPPSGGFSVGAGGLGGGGAGGGYSGTSGNNGHNATSFGSGGGGSGRLTGSDGVDAGNGFAGIVIIRYAV